MIRLTAIVSGNVQRVGYRARVIDIANAFGIKGMTENQKDGLVKTIAEGDEENLRGFESAIDIKNTLISVSAIVKTYSALRYLVWVTSGYRFSIPETKPRNESSMMGD